MTDLYELTRKLVARGCPEHPRLRPAEIYFNDGCYWGWLFKPPHMLDAPNARLSAEEKDHRHVDDDDARAIWTIWALEWAMRILLDAQFTLDTNTVNAYGWCDWARPDPQGAPSGSQEMKFLEAIEAATRHLEPSHSQEA